MKKIFFLLAILVACYISVSACDTTKINKVGWRVMYVDSEELAGEGANNGHAIHCFDNDSATFWHTQWQNVTSQYPHEIQIDLGDTFPVNGFSILTRANTKAGRIGEYHIYISNDSLNWGLPQSAGQLTYPTPASSEQQTATAFFGAVAGRYIRLVANASASNDTHTMIAELDFYQDTTCPPTGQQNQIVFITPIPRQFSTNPPITITASVSSGLPLQYEIVSGPATISDSTITLTGNGGNVVVRISQAGNDNFYPISQEISFIVTNLLDFSPTINTKLTSNYPVQMPELMPYLIHTNVVIEEPDSLTITDVRYQVDGVTTTAENVGGDYQFWWTPTNFGTHTISIIATASNGNTTTESVTVEVSNFIEEQSAQTLQSAVIDMGTIGMQWYYGSYELPQSVGAYSTILAYFEMSCPSVPGGCDDWDRLSWVQIKDPTGNWVELFRYITPYGVPCDHTIDVSDYASLLQGKLDFRVYIETWGTGGWQMDLTFYYEGEQPQYPYSFMEEIWQGTYNFGDPYNLQPMDTIEVLPFHGTERATLRLVTTGHGWGDNNTGNAAEFYHAIHHLHINGEETFTQDLWTTCRPNPDNCTGQHGTWYHNRAGWCPGTIARPFFYDLTPYLWQMPFQLQYIFQPTYIDLCHPHNPDCISGTTCPDCNESYNPHYRVSCYLIRYSTRPLSGTLGINDPVKPRKSAEEIDFNLYPNPTNGKFTIDMRTENKDLVCTIVSMSGKTLRTYFFKNSREVSNFCFDISSWSKGTYFVQIYTEKGLSAKPIVKQ